jgi:excisionase family DNA binding protein
LLCPGGTRAYLIFYQETIKKHQRGTALNQEGIPKTYTVKQVAEMLRVHVVTVRAQIKKRNIKAVKVGRHYLIFEDEVNRLLKEGWKGSRSGGPEVEG